jgi:hypothetical protein
MSTLQIRHDLLTKKYITMMKNYKPNQSLEAWRIRLRAMHDYIPDRAWDKKVHLDRVRILQVALSNFKGGRKGGCKNYGWTSFIEIPTRQT